METYELNLGRSDAQSRERPRRFRDGEELVGYTKQRVPIVMDIYAVDPLWGTREEELGKKQTLRAEMARIFSLPRGEQHQAWVDSGPNFRTFSQHQASYLALARVYTRDEIDFPGKVDDGGKFRIWLDEFRNAKATRARRRMVKRISQEILIDRRRAYPQENLVIASIACGSAMPVLEAIKALKDQGIGVEAKLLDFSGRALKFARKMNFYMLRSIGSRCTAGTRAGWQPCLSWRDFCRRIWSCTSTLTGHTAW